MREDLAATNPTKHVEHNAHNVLAKLRTHRMAKEVVLDRLQNRRALPHFEKAE